MASTDDFVADLSPVQTSLETFSSALQVFLSALDDFSPESSTPLERAKLCVHLSYLTNTLAWLQIRLDPASSDAKEPHPVTKELQNLKSYFERLKACSDPSSEQKGQWSR